MAKKKKSNSKPRYRPTLAKYYRNYYVVTPFLVGLLQGLENYHQAKHAQTLPPAPDAESASPDPDVPSIFGSAIDDALAKNGQALWDQLSEIIQDVRGIKKEGALETMREQFPSWQQSSAELLATLPEDQKKAMDQKKPVETLQWMYKNTQILSKTLAIFGIAAYKSYKISQEIPIDISSQAGIMVGKQLGYWLYNGDPKSEDGVSWEQRRTKWDNMIALVDIAIVSAELTQNLPVSLSVLCMQRFCMALAGHKKNAPELGAKSTKQESSAQSWIPEWLAKTPHVDERGVFQGISFPLVEKLYSTVGSTAELAGTALREQWKGKSTEQVNSVTRVVKTTEENSRP